MLAIFDLKPRELPARRIGCVEALCNNAVDVEFDRLREQRFAVRFERTATPTRNQRRTTQRQ